MDYLQTFRISEQGMSVERLRMNVTALNLAQMHSSSADIGSLYRPQRVVSTSNPVSFNRAYESAAAGGDFGGVKGHQVTTTSVQPRWVHEPGHPHANDKGWVAYPGVDHAAEMLAMTTSLRAYEANVVAFNAAKTMAARALEIGGQ